MVAHGAGNELSSVFIPLLEQQDSLPPDVYILSAQYGLISSEQPIDYYEQRMTAQRAEELRPRVLVDFSTVLDSLPTRVQRCY